jgi:hypothetical protein
MISNAPEFLANVCEAIYAEDPLGFEIKKAWARLSASMCGLGFAFGGAAAVAREAMKAVDEWTVEVEKRSLAAEFETEGL